MGEIRCGLTSCRAIIIMMVRATVGVKLGVRVRVKVRNRLRTEGFALALGAG